MDLLESGDERERAPLGARLRGVLAARPPAAVVALLAGVVLATLGGGAVGAVRVSDALAREAARVEVELRSAGSSSSTVGGVARGAVDLILVNQRDRAVRVDGLQVDVEGLRVLRVEPELPAVLGGRQELLLRVSFVVPSCDALVLPGTLALSVQGTGSPPQRRELAVHDAAEAGPADGVPLGSCPPSARGADAGTPTDVAVRSAGGSARRVGAGAEGFARLEIRNAGFELRLLSVDAQVPGVRFTRRRLDGGRSLETDGLVIVRLGFAIPDCRELLKSGRLVLRVERFDGVQELGLRVTAEPAAGDGPQVDLRVVLNACD